MKTTIFRSLALTLAGSLLATYSPAQKTDLQNDVAGSSYNQKDYRTPFANNDEKVIKSSSSVPYNGKVFQGFQKKFSDATDVRWLLEPNGTYHALFLKDGNLNAALLSKKGRMIYLINYLSTNNLPSDIKNMIEYTYDEFRITQAAKISDNSRTVWIVSLTGLNHHINVKVENGEMEEIDRFKLAN